MKKISKETREAAANICNARASWWETDVVDRYPDPSEARRLFGADAERLANAANNRAWDLGEFNDASTDRWLMAEALIREGWSP